MHRTVRLLPGVVLFLVAVSAASAGQAPRPPAPPVGAPPQALSAPAPPSPIPSGPPAAGDVLLLFVPSTAVHDFKAAVRPIADGWRMLDNAGALTEENGEALFVLLPRGGAQAEPVNATAIVDASASFLAKRAGHYLQTQPAFDMAEGLASAAAATMPTTGNVDDDPVVDGTWRFSGETALMVTTLKPQKEAAFLTLLQQVRTALLKSPRAVRREQARHWRVLKVTPASQGGAPVYVSFMDPVVRDTNYAWSAILADAFEGPDLIRAYSDYGDIVASVNLFDLTTSEP